MVMVVDLAVSALADVTAAGLRFQHAGSRRARRPARKAIDPVRRRRAPGRSARPGPGLPGGGLRRRSCGGARGSSGRAGRPGVRCAPGPVRASGCLPRASRTLRQADHSSGPKGGSPSLGDHSTTSRSSIEVPAGPVGVEPTSLRIEGPAALPLSYGPAGLGHCWSGRAGLPAFRVPAGPVGVEPTAFPRCKRAALPLSYGPAGHRPV